MLSEGTILTPAAKDLAELLSERARQTPNRLAFTFAPTRDATTANHDSGCDSSITYSTLRDSALRFASQLRRRTQPGDRALLLLPTGHDFLPAFFGCLYAGVIAVPAKLPRPRRSTDYLSAIIANASPRLVIMPAARLSEVGRVIAANALPAQLVCCEELADGDMTYDGRSSRPTPNTIAMLQYTSGSTSLPRGVMLTHHNLMSNLAAIQQRFQVTTDCNSVTWLPHYHDMGLIGGLLSPIYTCSQAHVMSPLEFLRRPRSWLEAISQNRATISGGPNFAYNLCAQADVTAADEFDLSCWRLAFNGAEPISARTLRRFVDIFSSCGFRESAFFPCYGLAESTLLVSGNRADQPRSVCLNRRSLQRHAVVMEPVSADSTVVVSSGQVVDATQVKIVSPRTQQECSADEIGEIWVAGPAVAKGYWKSPNETQTKFQNSLTGHSEMFFRTGDLGFLREGELFVTGRLKDLIIIRGSNHYPQDIETTVNADCDGLIAHTAAFPVDLDGQEHLAIACELPRSAVRTTDTTKLMESIRNAVSEQHDITPIGIVLLRPGQIPKTTSGKTQRLQCAARFSAGGWQEVARWAAVTQCSSKPHPAHHPVPRPTTQNELIEWLSKQVTATGTERPLNTNAVDINAVDIDANFGSFGLDSATIVGLAGKLESKVGRVLSPTTLYEFSTIRSLARHLSQEELVGAAAAVARKPRVEEPIAVVGVGCRFPQSTGPDAYWQFLDAGRSAVTPAPARDWWDPSVIGRGGFLDQVDEFDARFFGISPREAAAMDPQQRILLEVTWEALCDAGLTRESIGGSATGVFVGVSNNDYGRLAHEVGIDDFLLSTGNAHSITANRLSYHFDLRGPSLAVDTACSSSLVAVQQACQSLRSEQCEMAIAAGANLILSSRVSQLLRRGKFLSTDGKCYAFDARANGYVRGEGVGVVLLKPLSTALRDGDAIYCLIRGTSVTQDGRANGLTVPNPVAQRDVIVSALANSAIAPQRVSYIETHGTGTALGDPIEARVLGEVLSNRRDPLQPCWIGSVKTNIGHLEAAAGIASLIKVALMMQQGVIPPSLNFERSNPLIPLEELKLRVVTQRQPWACGDGELVAGISSFGFGGTNAHAIVTTASAPTRRSAMATTQLPQWRRQRYWIRPTSDHDATRQSVRVEPRKPGKQKAPINGNVSYSVGELMRLLQRELADVLHTDLEMLDVDQSIVEIGVDSVMGMEVAYAVEDHTGLAVPLEILADAPSIKMLAERLRDLQNSVKGLQEVVGRDDSDPNTSRKTRRRFPLRPVQQQLWTLGQIAAESGAGGILNIAAQVHCHGPVQIGVLQQALNLVSSRHDALRTSFEFRDSRIEQIVHPASSITVRVVDLRFLKRSDQQYVVDSETRRAVTEPIEPTSAPLVRADLMQLDGEEYLLNLVVSHLVCDGWSMHILSRELAEAYERISTGESALLEAAAPTQPHEIAGHDGRPGSTEPLRPTAPMSLPYDFDRPKLPSFRGRRYNFQWGAQLSKQIIQFSRQHNVTPFITLLAAVQVLCQRLSGQDDTTVGVPVTGRNSSRARSVVGPMMFPVPITMSVDFGIPFSNIVRKTQAAWQSARRAATALRMTPHEGPAMRPHHSQVLLDYQDVPAPLTAGNRLKMLPRELDTETAMAELGWSIRHGAAGFSGHLQYDTDLFTENTIRQIVQQLHDVLGGLLASTGPIGASVLAAPNQGTDSLLRTTLDDINQTEVDYRTAARIEELLMEQVHRTPDQIALIGNDEACSYRALAKRAKQISQILLRLGAGPDERVGLLLDRSIDAVAAIVGILQTGAAYVPIDPGYPRKRQRMVLDDARLCCVVTSEKFLRQVPADLRTANLDSLSNLTLNDKNNSDLGFFPVSADPQKRSSDTAYVLFTSGSSGRPKGVDVSHRNVINFFVAMDALQDDRQGGVWLAVTSLAFDISVFELLWTLTRGYTVVIQNDILTKNSSRGNESHSFASNVHRYNVTHIQCTPALMQILLEDADNRRAIAGLKKLFVGGDVMPVTLARRLASLVTGDVYNMYGPTETTIWSTAGKLTDIANHGVSIGRPVANTQVYILDEKHNQVPSGAAGELYIGGDGVTRGYFAAPELTSERFSDPLKTGARLFRTGDLVRLDANGNLVFLGRLDDQIKLHGHRIELGDIESHLLSHPHVKQAVVVVRKDQSGAMLCAYYVSATGRAVDDHELRSLLSLHLPAYMVPTEYVWRERFELTPNGKVDRKQLRFDAARHSGVGISPPTSDTTTSTPSPGVSLRDRAAQIIAQHLPGRAISHAQLLEATVVELGMNSLEVVRFAQQIEAEFGTRPPLASFFRDESIAEILAPMLRSPAIDDLDTKTDSRVAKPFPEDVDFEEGVV